MREIVESLRASFVKVSWRNSSKACSPPTKHLSSRFNFKVLRSPFWYNRLFEDAFFLDFMIKSRWIPHHVRRAKVLKILHRVVVLIDRQVSIWRLRMQSKTVWCFFALNNEGWASQQPIRALISHWSALWSNFDYFWTRSNKSLVSAIKIGLKAIKLWKVEIYSKCCLFFTCSDIPRDVWTGVALGARAPLNEFAITSNKRTFFDVSVSFRIIQGYRLEGLSKHPYFQDRGAQAGVQKTSSIKTDPKIILIHHNQRLWRKKTVVHEEIFHHLCQQNWSFLMKNLQYYLSSTWWTIQSLAMFVPKTGCLGQLLFLKSKWYP